MPQFRALSRIIHGWEEIEEGTGNIIHTVKEIPWGEIVEGLPIEIMKNLWNAGVLEEVPDKPAPGSTVTTTTTTRPAATEPPSENGSQESSATQSEPGSVSTPTGSDGSSPAASE